MRSGPKSRKPARATVERIAAEEACRARITLTEIIGGEGRQSSRITKARRRALLRIATETGCSASGVAEVWGIERRAVDRTFGLVAGIYDPMTINRLMWAHGEAKTKAILAGDDARSLADIRAWNRLGSIDGEAA